MKAIILAGGRGTRMRPITHTINKHLIPIAGQPMLFRVIRDVVDVGVKHIIININSGDKEVPAVVGTGRRWGVKIDYIEQAEPNGMMYPLKLAKDLIGRSKFIYHAGDNILSGGLKRHYKEYRRLGSNAHVLTVHRKDWGAFGVAKVKGDRVVGTVEKPKKFVSDLVLTAIYFFDSCALDAIDNVKPIDPKGEGKFEYYPPPVVNWIIKQGYKFTYSTVDGWWKDTGKPIDLNVGNQMAMSDMSKDEYEIKGRVAASASLSGRLKLGKRSVVSGNSVIRGPVIIGENCTIKNSFIGPYTTIGNNSVIENSEVENCIVMDEVEINTGMKRVVDSLVGHKAKISPNTGTLPTGHRLIIGENASVEL